ncbi:hypothetical protein TRIATDRAFT_219774 [Trichoderma atroviride IMI 206040]|uniref:Uncharacterized protein n=1 Tax=Hypocrea atroviridis (strain ATCC 20476 / IMI 206040) TaxID=452589 RepID=G9NT55_HYPAI|nr:uncharacterized protein TRIATDRAFT_219774 [Trichoderma atroviride IMI 206040]EHK45903.1 hypothetical protein TRIATDRAFT_219774 [Trichoderma atroviride IMI 206040]
MKNPTHGQWDGYRPSAELEDVFGRNLPLLKDVIDDINASITALQNAFQCFLPLEEEKERSKSLKDAMRKLRKRVKITIETKAFEDKIACLEKSNGDLLRLRKQVNELQTPSCCAIKRSSDRARKLPAEFGAYGSIRRASKALHEGLMATWSEAEVPSLRHLVKLFLDAKADTEVQMEIAILCYDDVLQRPLVETGLTRMQVRSRTMGSIAWSGASLLLPPSKMDESQRGQRKRQKVRFASISDSSDIVSEASPVASAVSIATSQSSTAGPDDLQLTGHFCSELSNRCSAPNISYNKEGLGHIDSGVQEAFRHCFFPWPKESHCNNMELDDVMPMDEALGQSAHNRLDIVSQLRLAHRLVSAVLKFNSTPWLKELWNVGDLAFFRQGDDLTESLQTLHFGVELTHSAPGSEDTAMEVESPASLVHLSIEDAQYKHGVRNVTLYSLGAALLAIGRWERVDHSDIEGIRRLASQRSYLGPVYQELTQKVLDCDFGYGKDLKKPRLQEAIYEMVILELESMIASLDISRD